MQRSGLTERLAANACFLISAVVGAGTAHAADHCNGATDSLEPALHGWYWTWENDAAGVIKTDHYYTQGAQLGYTFKHRKDDPGLMARLASPLCKLLGFNGNGEIGSKVLGASTLLIGQQLYTPRDTTASAPLPDDRPYAGWAYLGLRQELLQPLEPSTSSGSEGHRRWRTHSFELQLGVVGPSAGGEWTQRKAHDLDESPQSNGWHNQITDRFGWQAYYNFSNRMWSFDIGGCCDALVGDVLLQAMGAAGNLQQYAEAGGVVRLGRNMGPMAQRTMVPSALTASMRPIDASAKLNSDTTTCDTVWLLRPQECYVFAGLSARGVVKNIFLDKTTTGAGANISPEELVYEFTWGARLRYNWVRFDYISSTRTREFEPSPGNPLDSEGRHSFGSLTMSCYGQFGNNSGKLQWVCPGFVFGVAAFLAARD